MGRNEGTYKFSSNFELASKSPLDAKMLVGTKADLTTSTTWQPSSTPGQEWTYVGMIVSVWNDGSNNGIYRLTNIDYTNPANWDKLGASGDISALSVALSTEVSTRSSADASLTTRLSTELSTETAARNSADASLATRISSVAGDYVSKSTTVNGHALSSNVTVTASDVGLGNCNNTADANKSVNYANTAGSAPANGGNADTTDGLHVASGRNNAANQIVRTDGSGYIQAGYINSDSGDEGQASNPSRVWGTNGSDSYLRSYLTNYLSVNYAASAGSAAYADNAGLLDGIDSSQFLRKDVVISSVHIGPLFLGTSSFSYDVTRIANIIFINGTGRFLISQGDWPWWTLAIPPYDPNGVYALTGNYVTAGGAHGISNILPLYVETGWIKAKPCTLNVDINFSGFYMTYSAV